MALLKVRRDETRRPRSRHRRLNTALVLLGLVSITGCFVLEELRKGDELIEQHSSRWRKKKEADQARQIESAAGTKEHTEVFCMPVCRSQQPEGDLCSQENHLVIGRIITGFQKFEDIDHARAAFALILSSWWNRERLTTTIAANSLVC